MSDPNESPALSMHLLYTIPPETGQRPPSNGKRARQGRPRESGSQVSEFTLIALYLSPIAFAIHLRISLDPLASNGNSPENNPPLERLREDLRVYARTLHMRVREHGYWLPCVVVLELIDAPENQKTSVPQMELMAHVKSWESDQEWIRGDFLLFVEANADAAQKRFVDVLSPALPQLEELIEDEERSEEALLKKLYELPGAGQYLDKGLRDIRKNEELQSPQRTSTRRDPPAGAALDRLLPELTSIQKVSIQNFRGICKLETDVDADLILLVGPNGSGKSSFLEAIALAINGTLVGRAPGDLPHRSETDKEGSGGFELTITARTGESAEERANPIQYSVRYEPRESFPYQFRKDEKPVEPSTFFSLKSKQLSSDPDRFYFNARITTWLPEDLDLYFDETSGGKSLKQVLAPTPYGIRRLKGWFEDQKASREDERNRIDLTSTPDAQRQRRVELLRRWLESLLEQWNARPGLPTLPELPTLDASDVIRSWLERADMPMKNSIEDHTDLLRHLEGQIKQTRRRIESEIDEFGYGMLSREVEQLEQQEAEWLVRAQQAREDLRGFGGQAPDTADLEAVLRSLHQNLEGWRMTAHRLGSQLDAQVGIELEAVMSQALNNLRSVVSGFLADKRQILAKYDAISKEVDKKRGELDATRLSDDVKERLASLDALKRWLTTWARQPIDEQSPEEIWQQMRDLWSESEKLAKRQRDADRLDEELQILKDLVERCEKLMASGNDKTLRKNLQTAASQIFKRFAFLGADSMELEPLQEKMGDGYRARTGSRGLTEWSTGQKAQLAVVMAVAQNLVADLQKGLPHRVLILDDVSTAYDLSNITREALLWRQLAFGTPPLKRQIFLSSHHEELTQHLFDLLVPPQGRSVRVLRFKGWTEDHGPEVESFWLEPDARPARPAEARPLMSHLEEYLNP